MKAFETFFRALDARWDGGAIRLPIIGSAALMLQTSYVRGTKDGDVLETNDIGAAAKARLLQIGGPNTELAVKHRLYIDVVANGIPLLPHGPRFLPCEELNASLKSFRIEVLDVVDVVVSKFKRYSANDRADVDEMLRLGLVQHERLVERFRSAVDVFSTDARSEDLHMYVRRMNQVERDFFGVSATEFELSDWG